MGRGTASPRWRAGAGRLAALGCGLAFAAPAAAAAAPCRSARFTIDGAPLGRGTATSQTVEIGALVGLGDLCPLTPPPLPAGKLTLVDLAGAAGAARLLGTAGQLVATAAGADLRIALPPAPPAQAAHVFVLSPPAGS